MHDKLFPVPADVAAHALIDNDKYLAMYEQSVSDPEGFWGEHGKRIDWFKPYTKVKNSSFEGNGHGRLQRRLQRRCNQRQKLPILLQKKLKPKLLQQIKLMR